jgi:heme ABC exporter ATP-binding subunit CcmA
MALALRLRRALVLSGTFPALAGVDLEVPLGQAVLVQGPNGAGKSTLLRLCAGLLRLSGGEGEVLGVDLRRERSALRTLVGLVGHSNGLYDDLTVEENLRFQLAAARVGPERLESAMATFGLAGRLRSVPSGRLSAGQRRRTALASLSARDPLLWLLDEPYASLDHEGRQSLDRELQAAIGRDRSVLVVSHESSFGVEFCHRRIYLAGGRVVDARPEREGPELEETDEDANVVA